MGVNLKCFWVNKLVAASIMLSKERQQKVKSISSMKLETWHWVKREVLMPIFFYTFLCRNFFVLFGSINTEVYEMENEAAKFGAAADEWIKKGHGLSSYLFTWHNTKKNIMMWHVDGA